MARTGFACPSPCETHSVTIEPLPLPLLHTQPEVFAGRLGRAFERWGFAVVSDHGFAPDTVSGAYRLSQALFALPDTAKAAYRVPGSGSARGYTPFGVETAKGARLHDLKEFWHIGRERPEGSPADPRMPPNLWPEELPGFRDTLLGLYAELDRLGLALLRAVAIHLGLAEDWFSDRVEGGNSLLRLLHYPPLNSDSANGHLRAEAHEDINVLTLLLGAEEAGLELLDRDGHWRAINPPPACVVVNIGDMLARLTNDVLPSTTHRVVNPDPDRLGVARYSMPFFLHFRPEVEIRTLPGCVSAQRPDRYPEPISAHAFLQQRLREIKLA